MSRINFTMLTLLVLILVTTFLGFILNIDPQWLIGTLILEIVVAGLVIWAIRASFHREYIMTFDRSDRVVKSIPTKKLYK